MAEFESTKEALRARVSTAMATDTAHDLSHLDRVWRNAALIAGNTPVDLNALLGASYLHDLVNLPKDDPDRARASRRSAEAARPILTDLGYSPDSVEIACHAIEAHSYSAGIQPQSLEAKILRDADRLDALGAIGIARNFSVAGQLRQVFYDPDDPFAQQRDLDEGKYTLDHWQTKLLRLRDGMLTEAGKRLAAERTLLMLGFLSNLSHEIGVDLPETFPPWSE